MSSTLKFTASGLLSLGALTACNQPPAVNPWRDDSIPSTSWNTPSAEMVACAQHPPVIRQRQIEPTAAVADAGVPHYPHWWEDPFDDQGDGNQEQAWTWQDYLVIPYGFGRFLLNTMGAPISMIVTLPGTPMVSDGVVEKVHDAKPGVAPVPQAQPGELGFSSNAPPFVILTVPDSQPSR